MKVSREERLARIRMNEGLGQHVRNNRRDRLRAQHFVRPTPVNPSALSSSFTDYDSDSTPKPSKVTKRMNPDGTMTTVRSSSVQFYDGGSTTIREAQFEASGGREPPYRGNNTSNYSKPPSPAKRRPNRPRPESPINPINRAHRIIRRHQQDQQLQTIDVRTETTTNAADRYPSRGRSPARRDVASNVAKRSGNQIRTQTYSDDSYSSSKKATDSPSPARNRNAATSSISPGGSRMKIISIVNDGSESRSSKSSNSSPKSTPQQADKRGSFSPQSTQVELGSGNKERQKFRLFGASDSKKKAAKVKSGFSTPDGTDDDDSVPPPPPPSPSKANRSSNSRGRGGNSKLEEEKEHRLSSSGNQETKNPVNGLEMVQEEPGRFDQRFKPLSTIGRVRASQRYPKEIHQADNASCASSITTTPDRNFVAGKKMLGSQQQQQQHHHHEKQQSSPPMINRIRGRINGISTLQESDLEDDAYLSSRATMGKPNDQSRRPQGSHLRTPPSQYSAAQSGILSSSPGLRTNDSFDKILNPTPPSSREKNSPADTYESFDSLMSSNTERDSRNGQEEIEMNKSRYVSRTKSLFDSSTVDSESLRTDPMQLRDRKTGYTSSDQSLSTTRGFNVTVVKKTPNDKLGINVGRKKTRFGHRLIVTKISPTGLFVDSPIEVGDIVQSINGIDFLGNPNSSKALGTIC